MSSELTVGRDTGVPEYRVQEYRNQGCNHTCGVPRAVETIAYD